MREASERVDNSSMYGQVEVNGDYLGKSRLQRSSQSPANSMRDLIVSVALPTGTLATPRMSEYSREIA